MAVTRPRPMYEQIADDLRQLIHTGALPVGADIEAEPVLADRYGTSRVTINRAVQILRSEGLVQVRRGDRTVVAGDHLAVTVHLPRDVHARAVTAAAAAEVTVAAWLVDAARRELDDPRESLRDLTAEPHEESP